MSFLNSSVPTHLSIFVADPDSGQPVARLPLYAEVAVPRIVPMPAVNERFREPMRAALFDVDPTADGAVRNRIEETALQALGQTVDEASRNQLLAQPQQVMELFQNVFKEALVAANRERMADIPPADLKPLIVAALRRLGVEIGLDLLPEVEDVGIIWADPLGVLTTDHVGYVSFDLKRLRPEVRVMLAEAIEARRNDLNADLKLAIWIYPYGYAGKFDAFSQARFAFDAVVARLAMKWNTLPPALINMAPRALQNPSLTDWQLSPASFAASPKTLIGENGCEELVPANLALQEFVLRQVVRVTDPPADAAIPEPYKFAYVDDYKVSWFSLGHSLGEILYSLPLAPAESVKLAVIDWSWDSLTKRDEQTKLTEELLHQTHRDRTITETVKAGLKEFQHGSSFMGGMANAVGASGGANLGVVGLGAAAGNTWSLGGSTATSDGSRDLAAENVQRLSDSFSQASSAQREINSTVVIQARQEEKESIQTRTFTNYNHSHTLTVLYYEVLRHYRVTTEWVRRRRATLIKLPAALTFDAANTLKHRWQLEPALLDPSLAAGFTALAKRETIHAQLALNGTPNGVPGQPGFWEGDLEFELFELGIQSKDGEGTKEVVVAYLITKDTKLDEKKYELRYVYKGSGPIGEPHNINSGQRMQSQWGVWTFVKPFNMTTGGFEKVRWGDIIGFQFEKWGDNDQWRIDYLTINGLGANGLFVSLTEGARDVDLWFEAEEPGSQSFTWIKRPGPRGPDTPPIPSAELSMTAEENAAIAHLLDHLTSASDYYNRVVMLGTDPNVIAVQFEATPWTPGKTLDDAVQPYPLEIFGSYMAYPLAAQPTTDDTLVVDIAAAFNGNDAARRQWATDRLAAMSEADRSEVMQRVALAAGKSERLITLPTRGVFAEGKLGHCNVSEEIDNTRFWKWEEHPIPFEAPGINPVTPIQPEPQQVSTTPTAFPQSLVNIVNPSPAPDPTGLGAALSLLATPNIFRDMSGRQEVADLLKKLSDNSIAIAEAANRAREIQAKYGTDLDKNEKDLTLGQTQANAEVARAAIQQRRDEAQQVKPSEAQDAIKLSESETRKGNKTPEEHKAYSKQVQDNVKGAQPKKPAKPNITLQINLEGYGPRRLVGRFGTTVKQRGNDVGFLKAIDSSDLGYLKVGVLNDYDDNRYDVVVEGEVLGGVGINAMLKGGGTVVIPRADFDLFDYFYLKAVAKTETLDFETTKSDEVIKEVASKLGASLDLAYKKIITMTVEGGGEWKDGQTHTTQTAVKVKVVYYTGGFSIAYDKGE